MLQQQRNLAMAEDNLIAAHAAYAKDRAGLYQTLASTLQHYGINLPEAAAGTVTAAPVIPGVAAGQARQRAHHDTARGAGTASHAADTITRIPRNEENGPAPIRAILLPNAVNEPLARYRSATRSRRSKNSGKLMAADSAP